MTIDKKNVRTPHMVFVIVADYGDGYGSVCMSTCGAWDTKEDAENAIEGIKSKDKEAVGYEAREYLVVETEYHENQPTTL